MPGIEGLVQGGCIEGLVGGEGLKPAGVLSQVVMVSKKS